MGKKSRNKGQKKQRTALAVLNAPNPFYDEFTLNMNAPHLVVLDPRAYDAAGAKYPQLRFDSHDYADAYLKRYDMAAQAQLDEQSVVKYPEVVVITLGEYERLCDTFGQDPAEQTTLAVLCEIEDLGLALPTESYAEQLYVLVQKHVWVRTCEAAMAARLLSEARESGLYTLEELADHTVDPVVRDKVAWLALQSCLQQLPHGEYRAHLVANEWQDAINTSAEELQAELAKMGDVLRGNEPVYIDVEAEADQAPSEDGAFKPVATTYKAFVEEYCVPAYDFLVEAGRSLESVATDAMTPASTQIFEIDSEGVDSVELIITLDQMITAEGGFIILRRAIDGGARSAIYGFVVEAGVLRGLSEDEVHLASADRTSSLMMGMGHLVHSTEQMAIDANERVAQFLAR